MEATSTDGEMTIINMKVMCASAIHPSIIFLFLLQQRVKFHTKCQVPTNQNWIIRDDAFSLDTGLELIGVDGRLLGRIDIQSAHKWWSDGGMLAVSPMLSHFLSYEMEKDQLLIVL